MAQGQVRARSKNRGVPSVRAAVPMVHWQATAALGTTTEEVRYRRETVVGA
jgi:hypothetical protein